MCISNIHAILLEDAIMANLIISIFGTICILSLLLYDFACLCKFLGKEKWAEYLWYKFIPNKEFKEEFFFVFGKSIFLYASMMCYFISASALNQIILFRIILSLTPCFAFLSLIKNLKK